MSKVLKNSFAIFAMAILSLAVACNSTPDSPKTKEIPKEAMTEEKVHEEAEAAMDAELEAEAEVVDQSAVLKAELAALEASLNSEAPSRSKAAPSATMEDPVQKCQSRCEKILDASQNSDKIGSGANATKAYDKCMEGCRELSQLCDRFQECIKNAKTDEEKKACRQNYMDNRPWDHLPNSN